MQGESHPPTPASQEAQVPAQRVVLAVVAFVLLLAILVMVPRVVDAVVFLFERRRALDERERALLALAAPYARLGGMGDVDLAGLRPRRRQAVWNALARDWAIRGRRPRKRDLARQALDGLHHPGGRGNPALARAPGKDEMARARALLAWDCARLVHLTRLCFFAGYIDEAEAWAYIQRAAGSVSRAFDSWSEYGDALLAGRALSMGAPDAALARAVAVLHSDPQSPWRRYSWGSR